MAFFWKRLKKSTPEQEEEFRQRMQEENVGWKDTLAIILSAFLTLVLPCLLVLLALGGLMLWLFS